MIRKTVIATHGTLAEGFLSALKIIVSADETIQAVNCYTTEGFDIEKVLDDIFDSLKEDEELFVFTDLLGGSVNNAFIKRLEKHPFHLVTNTSLGLLMDYRLMQPDADTLKQKLTTGEFSAVYCNDLIEQMKMDEDDDL